MSKQIPLEYRFKLVQKDIDHIIEIQKLMRHDIREIRQDEKDNAKTQKQLMWTKRGLGLGFVTLLISIFFNVWFIFQSNSSNEPKDKPMGNSSQVEKDSTKTKK